MTPAEVNALPEPVRTYVFDLETRCDPSGDVQRIASLTEQRDALVILLQERDATIADLRAQVAAAEAKGRREMRGEAAVVAADLAIKFAKASSDARDRLEFEERDRLNAEEDGALAVMNAIRALPDTAPEVNDAR